MVRRTRTLTVFGKDLDSLLKQAGKFTLREYADECGVSYKYLSQLRTIPDRRPGRLYMYLLKPFTRLQILGLADSHRLSLRHRGKPLSFTECQELFPDLPEQELVESVKQAVELRDTKDIPLPVIEPAGARDRVEVPLPDLYRRLYRRVFIGRQAELNELRLAFDMAMAGQGMLVMVMGEPGIGKTALCGQLATYVTGRGGMTLVGHCYEAGSLSLPYLAFVEALRSYVLARDAAHLTKELGTGAAEVARIVPEIAAKIKISPRTRGDPDEERYRLLQAVTDFLGNAAMAQPLLIVLEDLHGADRGTLEMLEHVARNLNGKRFLLVGTYRDVEVDRAHPLSSALAELRRLPSFGRVLLRGLNDDEVSRMLSSIIGRDAPAGLGKAVHRQTEGNPLFVEEVAHYLVEEGTITRDGELTQLAQDMPIAMRIPDGLRDVIGKRVSGLSEACNRMLSVAAVIGRDSPLEVLQKVAKMPEEELLKALEEARKAGVIEESTEVGAMVRYRFAHAFFRQTLYEEIIAPRRIRLHQQVGRALEEVYRARLQEHAAELAEHFSHSSDSADLKKAVAYGEIAAERAMSVFAYGEAVRLLEQALKVQEVLDAEDKGKQCDLLLSRGWSRCYASEPRHVLDIEAPQALSLAEAMGDGQRACRACELAWMGLIYNGFGGSFFATPEAVKWMEKLDGYARPDTVERVWADIGKALLTTKPREVLSLLKGATALARRLGDAEGFFWAVVILGFDCPPAPEYVEEVSRLLEELKALLRKPGTRVRVGLFVNAVEGNLLLGMGQRERAEELWREHRELARHSRMNGQVLISMTTEAIILVLDGKFEEAMEINRNILSSGEELGIPVMAELYASFTSYTCRVYLGKPEEILREQERMEEQSGLPAVPSDKALVLAHCGRQAEARQILDEFIARYTSSDEGFSPPWYYANLLEAAVLARHRPAAEFLLGVLRGTPFRTTGWIYPTCIARHLGAACALLNRPDEARQYYREAIKVCMEMRFRPELALSRLQLAELLLENYPDEKKEALEHLDFAIKEFREMKMQPSLERALRHKDILRA